MALVTFNVTRVGDGTLMVEVVRVDDHRTRLDTVWWCNGATVGFLIRDDLRDLRAGPETPLERKARDSNPERPFPTVTRSR